MVSKKHVLVPDKSLKKAGRRGKHLEMSVRKAFITSIEDERRPAVEKTSWMKRMKAQNISLWQKCGKKVWHKNVARKYDKEIWHGGLFDWSR